MSREKILNVAQHSAVLQKALDIYIQRSTVRGELWAGSTVETMLYDASSKLARARGAVQMLSGFHSPDDPRAEPYREEALDSLADLINFAAFAHRHITGEKPDVPSLGYEAPPAA